MAFSTVRSSTRRFGFSLLSSLRLKLIRSRTDDWIVLMDGVMSTCSSMTSGLQEDKVSTTDR